MSNTQKLILLTLTLITCVAVLLLVTAPWKDDGKVLVSGIITTYEVEVNLKHSGRVTEVHAKEGEVVKIGDVLLRLEDDVLDAQYHQAEAELAKMIAEYNLLKSQPLQEQHQAMIANAELDVLCAEQSLQDLFDNANQERAKAQQKLEVTEEALEDLLNSNVQKSQAKVQIASAKRALDSAKRKYLILSTPPTQVVIDQAYANVLLAESVLNDTREDLKSAKEKLQGNLGPDIPKEYYIVDYKSQFRQIVQALEFKLTRDALAYEHAHQEYQELLEPPDQVDLALAEADLRLAEAELKQAQREYLRLMDGPSEAEIVLLKAKIEAARREYDKWSDGPDPDKLNLANARIRQEKAKLALAKTNTIAEQLEVARVRVESANDTLKMIRIIKEEMIVKSPCNCIILNRDLEVGEVVHQRTIAFTLIEQNRLTITLFFPEEYLQQIEPDNIYQIHVDAFPDQSFDARVIDISDKSRLLSRNIITPDPSSKNVFAVELEMINPEGILKPGMTAHLLMIHENNIEE